MENKKDIQLSKKDTVSKTELEHSAKKLTQEFATLKEAVISHPTELGNFDISNFDQLTKMTVEFIAGKLPASPSVENKNPVHLEYASSVDELIKKQASGRMKYNIWQEGFFSSSYANSKFPTGYENAVPQLGINLWWAGNETKEPGNILNGIRRIAEVYRTDYIEDLKTKFMNDPKSKENAVQFSKRQADNLLQFQTESVNISLQYVYYDPTTRRPFFNKDMSLRVARVVTGEKILTLKSDSNQENQVEILLTNNLSYKELPNLFDLIGKASDLYSPHFKR